MEKQNDLIDVTDNKPAVKKKKTPVKKPTTKAVAVLSESGTLLEMAINNGLSVEQIGQLIDMKVKEEARQCKKDFDLHFAEMQKDYIPATKGNSVLNKTGDKILYKFCSLENILKVYSPIIANHGFSFRWKEDMVNEKIKKISCIISGYGYEEIGSVEIPIAEGNNFTNPVQQRGVSTSYGKRYSFINSFGVIIEDEDDDAASLTFNDGVEYAEQIVWLKSCNSREDLLTVFKKIVDELKKKNDTIGKGVLTAIYTDLKKELK